MENQNETGSSFNFSRASRTSDVEVNKELMKKYDEQRAKLIRLSWRPLGFFLIMLSLSLKLYVDAHWVWGTLPMLVALFALFRFYAYRNAGGASAYTSGLLVPAIVVRTNPIELIALADVCCDDAGDEQFAYKRFAVKNLPLHKVVEGERIPCMALFGGSTNGQWANFEPRPLCWVTDDANAIKHNIDRIEEREWDILRKITDDTTAATDDIVLLDVDKHTSEVRRKTNKIAYGGLSFCYPDSWKIEKEEGDNGIHYIYCEKKGDDSSEIISVNVVSPQVDVLAKLEETLNSMKQQEVYHNMSTEPVRNVSLRDNDAILCSFVCSFSNTKYFGRIYILNVSGKTFTVLMQDEEDDFENKFKFFTDSFTII